VPSLAGRRAKPHALQTEKSSSANVQRCSRLDASGKSSTEKEKSTIDWDDVVFEITAKKGRAKLSVDC
jgi:hypothetical protein